MSPAEIDIYNNYQAQNQADPERGPLNFQDYYPGFQSPGAVGNYSGSVVGSNSLFGGGAALIPIGMMDARDVAVQKAAMQKQKEVADFRKQFEAPTSKLTNINKNLTDEYLDHVNNGWNVAMKKANGDPNLAKKILEADTDFWKKEKSYKNVALEGDDMKNQIARIDTAVEKGELISAKAKEARDRLLTSLNPNNPDFKEAQRNFAQVNAEIDLSKTFEQALDNAVTTELGTALDKSSPDYNRVLKESIEKLSPETKEAIIHLVQKSREGSKLYTAEEIEKVGSQLMNYEKKKQDLSISNKPQDESADYDESNIVSQSAEKNRTRGQDVNSYTEHYVPTNAVDQKKELKFSVSDDMVSADGQPVNAGESGYVKGFVQGIGVKPFYKKENRFLNDDEVKVAKDRGIFETTDEIEMRPAVIFNLAATKEEPDTQKTIYFDTNKLAGMFKSRIKSDKDYEAMRKKTEKYADEKNKGRGKKTEAKKKDPLGIL